MTRVGRIAAAVALASAALVMSSPAISSASVRSAHMPSATPYGGTPTVGALFITGLFPLHICTASVVRSADRSVIMTAAHCVRSGTGEGYEFAPGFHDGKAPYGMWRVTAAYAAPGWIRSFDNHDDFAFLVVSPKRIDGKVRHLQDVTGANHLGRTPRVGSTATVIGYPLGIGGSSIHCTSTIYRKGPFTGFNCNGFRDGTSGGPWLEGHGDQRRVVGVVGGLHQGGCTAAQLYAAPLGDAAHKALRRAAHHGRADHFPAPPSDGC